MAPHLRRRGRRQRRHRLEERKGKGGEGEGREEGGGWPHGAIAPPADRRGGGAHGRAWIGDGEMEHARVAAAAECAKRRGMGGKS